MVEQGRTSVRQAVLVVAREASAPDLAPTVAERGEAATGAILSACLLDLLGTLVRLDGASLSVLCASRGHARTLAGLLPAGVDLLVGSEGESDPLAAALARHFARDFARVVAVAGDAVGVPTRTVATALGALAGAAAAIGPTPGGGSYLLAVRRAEGAAFAALPAEGALPAAATVAERATAAGLTVRRVEPRPRLAELRTPAALRDALAAGGAPAPRLEDLTLTQGAVGTLGLDADPAGGGAPPFGPARWPGLLADGAAGPRP